MLSKIYFLIKNNEYLLFGFNSYLLFNVNFIILNLFTTPFFNDICSNLWFFEILLFKMSQFIFFCTTI